MNASRWLAGLLLVVAIGLGGCSPDETEGNGAPATAGPADVFDGY